MGSKYLYQRANRGATPLQLQPETPMPPDQVTCLPVINGIFHYGLSVRCVQERGYQLTKPYPTYGRDKWQHETSMGVTGTRLDLRSTQEAYVFPVVVSTIKCSFNSNTKTGPQPLHVPTCITSKAWSHSNMITLLPVTVFLLYLLLQVSHDRHTLHGTRKHANTTCMQILFEFNICMIQLFLQTFNHAITI